MGLKPLRFFAITAFVAALFVSAVHAGPGPGRWDQYTPSTFTAALMNTKFASACDLCFTPGIPYTIEAKYLGQSRPITEGRKKLVQGWQKSIGRLGGFEDLFSVEILIFEGGKERWLPIQGSLMKYMTEENPNGGMIEMSVVLIGALKANSPDEDYVFVINGFGSLRDEQ